MKRRNESIEATLDELLRNEISAAETYRIALEHVEDPKLANTLRDIQQNHGDAIRCLHGQIKDRGGVPSKRPGMWDKLAISASGLMSRIGEKASLRALRERERVGLSNYNDAMSAPALPNRCINLFENVLLPRQRTHVELLDHHIRVA